MDFQRAEIPELLRACAEGRNPDAWREFFARFHNVIASTVIKSCRSYGKAQPELVDDLIQDTYVKLCAHSCQALREFRPDHPDAFFGYLQRVAHSVVLDDFRSKFAAKRGSGNDELPLETVSCAGARTGNMERDILISEIRDRLKGFSARDRCIFWLHHREGMTASAISKIAAFGLTSKGIESTLRRLILHLRSALGPSATEQ
jgi:RNA polymerase sigma factor (sigma-70 family)